MWIPAPGHLLSAAPIPARHILMQDEPRSSRPIRQESALGRWEAIALYLLRSPPPFGGYDAQQARTIPHAKCRHDHIFALLSPRHLLLDSVQHVNFHVLAEKAITATTTDHPPIAMV